MAYEHDSTFYGNTKIQFVSITNPDLYWEEDGAWMRVKNIRRKGYSHPDFLQVICYDRRLYPEREKKLGRIYFLKTNLGMNTQARHLKKELWESVKGWGFWKESIFLKGLIIKSLQYAYVSAGSVCFCN